MLDYKITYRRECEWGYIGFAPTEEEARATARELEERARAEGGTVSVYDPNGKPIHTFAVPRPNAPP